MAQGSLSNSRDNLFDQGDSRRASGVWMCSVSSDGVCGVGGREGGSETLRFSVKSS